MNIRDNKIICIKLNFNIIILISIQPKTLMCFYYFYFYYIKTSIYTKIIRINLNYTYHMNRAGNMPTAGLMHKGTSLFQIFTLVKMNKIILHPSRNRHSDKIC